MKVGIKRFNVDMEVKNTGVEFGVHSNSGDHLGDLVITKTRLIWCEGRTRPQNGVPIAWEEFIEMMNNRQ